MDNTDEMILITDPEARRWYNFGFLFAINYIYQRLPEINGGNITPENFKEFFNNRLTHKDGDLVEDEFFEKYPFRETDPIKYGPGECPGDLPNTCIPCTVDGIKPLR